MLIGSLLVLGILYLVLAPIPCVIRTWVEVFGAGADYITRVGFQAIEDEKRLKREENERRKWESWEKRQSRI